MRINSSEIESFAKFQLLSHLGDLIQDVTVTADRRTLYISVKPAGQESREKLLGLVEDVFEENLRPFGLRTCEVIIDDFVAAQIPPADVLLAVQAEAPASIDQIVARLSSGSDAIVSLPLVKRHLDSLRRDNLLIFVGNDSFALTLSGIRVAAKLRSSKQDIARVLRLGRQIR